MPVGDNAPSERLHAGRVADYLIDRFRIVEAGGRSIGVVRTSEGFFAVVNRCPHMGAPICVGSNATKTTLPSRPFEYILDEAHAVVRCPWHRWEFRLDSGESVGRVTNARLISYPVVVDGNDVFIDLQPRRGPAKAPVASAPT